jgi:hypothetical protein
LNYAAIQAAKAKDAAKSNDLSRVVKGSYKDIIDLTEQQFGLEAGSISIHTVKSRLKKNRRLTASGKGNVSPLVTIEATFIEVLLELAAMRQPLTAREALNLINSMIKDSCIQEELIEWKKNMVSEEKVQALSEKCIGIVSSAATLSSRQRKQYGSIHIGTIGAMSRTFKKCTT